MTFFTDFTVVPAGRSISSVQPVTDTLPVLLTVYCTSRLCPRASSTSYVARRVGVAAAVDAYATALPIASVPAPSTASSCHRRVVAIWPPERYGAAAGHPGWGPAARVGGEKKTGADIARRQCLALHPGWVDFARREWGAGV